jgi:Fur family ferric uptake transcriptional regulator
VSDLEQAMQALRDSGHRVTAARRLVLEALFDADGPVSAEYLARGMGGARTPMDTASVHRNLAQLEELGLVRHVHIGHGPGLYALVRAEEREYLACERCGQVTSVEPAKLESVRRSIRRSFGYEARFTHFPILGLCESCSRQVQGAGKRDAAKGAHQHSHEHSHGDHVHSHPHAHGKGPGGAHEHNHSD